MVKKSSRLLLLLVVSVVGAVAVAAAAPVGTFTLFICFPQNETAAVFHRFCGFFTAFSGRLFNFRQSGFLPLFYEVHFCGKLSGFCRIRQCGKKTAAVFFGGKQMNRPNVLGKNNVC